MNPITPEQRELARLLDTEYLRVLKEGEEVVVSGPEGVNVIKKKPSAAMLKAIQARVKELGIDTIPATGTAAGTLLDQARTLKFDGKTIPELDMEDDDAATGT